jgi:hypothetical protein
MDAVQFLENIVHFDSDTYVLRTGRKREQVAGLVSLADALTRVMCHTLISYEISRGQDDIHAL